VVPGHADVICDCRPLPGDTEGDVRDHVAAALGEDFEYELEFLEPLEGGTESPIDTPLYEAIERYVADRLDGAALLPVLSLGFADAAFVRAGWGTAAYGFAPVFNTDLDEYNRGVHATDEKIAVADLVEMAEFHLRAARSLASD
jgi:acetylornithine deacetylase/succinyl-diaminopimelate desuccinylase-like protein